MNSNTKTEKFSPHVKNVNLPSKGIPYPKTSPLSSGTMELKYPSAINENILNDKVLINNNTVINEFIQSLIVDKKNINVNNLINEDFNYLMFVSRILTYGADYPVSFKCPACDNKIKKTINLNDIDSDEIDVEKINDTIIREDDNSIPLFRYELNDDLTIIFKLLTISDEIKLSKEDKKMRRKKMKSMSITNRLNTMIVDIVDSNNNSILNQDNINLEKIKFINNDLSTIDSKNFRIFIKNLMPQLDSKIYDDCEYCGNEYEIEIPFNKEFFWPESV